MRDPDPSPVGRGGRPVGSRRYAAVARYYDLLSGERPVYRIGRQIGVRQLRLQPGFRVLDLGCGTGLSFPLLRAAVGPGGRVVGVDMSSAMLERARARVSHVGWGNVECIHADAGDLGAVLSRSTDAFDAVLMAYSLSVMPGWEAAFGQAWQAVAPDGRVAVVDMALPAGPWRVLAPVAWLACVAGGADPHRAPWRLVERDADDVSHHVVRGGHIHVVAGTHP